MSAKKITIFLVPDGTKGVKQFSVPKFLPVFVLTFLILSLGFCIWVIRDYHTSKARCLELARFKSENALQKKQLVYIARRIDQFTHKIGELKKLDHKLRVMVNLETSEDQEEFRGVGGSDPILLDPEKAIAKVDRELIRSMHRSLDNLSNEIDLNKQDKAELHKFLESQKILLASTPSIWPAKGWLSSRFGYRTSPFTGKKEFHKGVDISARKGAPIVASADGVISFVGWDRGYGRVVLVKHGYGLATKYAHLKKALVKKGQHIKRGETIALVGNSGRTTGSHLHYEVHLNGVAVNPLHYILN